MKRFALVVLAMALISAPAFAGNRPEFDAVGDDSANFFNGFVETGVIGNAFDGYGNPINVFSDFTEYTSTVDYSTCSVASEDYPYSKGDVPWEFFYNTAGTPYPDPCFPGYLSALTDVYNEGVYEWQIVLQMKPESDLNLNIRDCVLKHNEFNPYFSADQTGRYRQPWGQLVFLPGCNPQVTALALPGPYRTSGFKCPLVLDARVLPGLGLVPLTQAFYTSKGIWEEGLVVALPQTGTVNQSGQTEYNLKQGDKIYVRIDIPGCNTVDVRYGASSVVAKYIGVVGTELDTAVLQP